MVIGGKSIGNSRCRLISLELFLFNAKNPAVNVQCRHLQNAACFSISIFAPSGKPISRNIFPFFLLTLFSSSFSSHSLYLSQFSLYIYIHLFSRSPSILSPPFSSTLLPLIIHSLAFTIFPFSPYPSLHLHHFLYIQPCYYLDEKAIYNPKYVSALK